MAGQIDMGEFGAVSLGTLVEDAFRQQWDELDYMWENGEVTADEYDLAEGQIRDAYGAYASAAAEAENGPGNRFSDRVRELHAEKVRRERAGIPAEGEGRAVGDGMPDRVVLEESLDGYVGRVIEWYDELGNANHALSVRDGTGSEVMHAGHTTVHTAEGLLAQLKAMPTLMAWAEGFRGAGDGGRDATDEPYR